MQKTLLLLTIILSVSLCQSLDQDQSVQICTDQANGFNTFNTIFGKQYTDSLQEQDAYLAFKQCCNYILEGATNPSLGYTSALHSKCDIKLSDTAPSTLQFPPGGLSVSDVPPTTSSSSSGSINQIVGNVLGSSCPPNYQSLCTPVQDQGNCGDCWVFATTAAYQSAINRVSKEVLDLSQEYVLQCTTPYNVSATPASSCGGGIIDYALQMITNTGIASATTYPYAAYTYSSNTGYPRTISNCSNTTGFSQLNFPGNNSHALWHRYNNITPSAIQTLLAQGTLVVAYYAVGDFYTYNTGVYSCPVSFSTAYHNVNHALELVGMDCSGNYIVKNSWGTTWGAEGFATIDPNNDCGISAYVYSINYQPYLLTSILISLVLLHL